MEGKAGRQITYCIVPADIAGVCHDALRKHFGRKSNVEVLVERRSRPRRAEPRRAAPAETEAERRRVRVADGRRAADRRATEGSVQAPHALPEAVLPHAERLRFVQRIEPTGTYESDRDSERQVARFQAGDRDAFAVLYARYFDKVYAYVRAVVANPDQAETAVQDTFSSALAALDGFEPTRERPFRGWLFELAVNSCAQLVLPRAGLDAKDPARLAKRRAAEIGLDPQLRALSLLDDGQRLATISRIPSGQSQVLMLRFMFGLTPAEIAAVLGCSADDARILQHGAMTKLAETLPRRRAEPALRD